MRQQWRYCSLAQSYRLVFMFQFTMTKSQPKLCVTISQLKRKPYLYQQRHIPQILIFLSSVLLFLCKNMSVCSNILWQSHSLDFANSQGTWLQETDGAARPERSTPPTISVQPCSATVVTQSSHKQTGQLTSCGWEIYHSWYLWLNARLQ